LSKMSFEAQSKDYNDTIYFPNISNSLQRTSVK
ncbi:MAG: hypothetical protein ACJA1P_002682, partial [Maribacter sp.]